MPVESLQADHSVVRSKMTGPFDTTNVVAIHCGTFCRTNNALIGNERPSRVRQFGDKSPTTLPLRRARLALLPLLAMAALLANTGCQTVDEGAYPVCNIPPEYAVKRRTLETPIDVRLLDRPAEVDHIIDDGDTLGIYIADILGTRDELPAVDYPNFRLRNGPVEPYVGQPVRVQNNGTIHLPYLKPLEVKGMTLAEVRAEIILKYVYEKQMITEGTEHVEVSMIAPRAHRIHVVRQDTRYNVPGLQRSDQFEISRRWAGSTLYLEKADCTVLTALMRTGGMPGIDARNEIWVMKGLKPEECEKYVPPTSWTLAGEMPMVLTDEDSRIIRIPLEIVPGEPPPFDTNDIVLEDGDVVFLPRRDGDVFLTGGLLGGGRYPLNRDRDLDILEAMAATTGNTLGPVGSPKTATQFRSGPGNVIAPSNVVIVRRIADDQQIKITVDLKKALSDPSERILIAPGDLIILRYRPREIVVNTLLNLTDFSLPLNTLW